MDADLRAELMALYADEGKSLLTELSALCECIASASNPQQDDAHRKTALRVAHNFAGIAGATGFMSAMRVGQTLDLVSRGRMSTAQLELAKQATALLLLTLGKHGHEEAHDELGRLLRG